MASFIKFNFRSRTFVQELLTKLAVNGRRRQDSQCINERNDATEKFTLGWLRICTMSGALEFYCRVYKRS